MAAVTSIMRVHQIFLDRVSSVLRPYGLTFSRFEVLRLLSFTTTGAMPLNRIGSRLQVHPTSVTNAIDRLEAGQFVRRFSHETDRRTTLAEILPAGRKIVDNATKAINSTVFESPSLSQRDINNLVKILKNLRFNAGDFVE